MSQQSTAMIDDGDDSQLTQSAPTSFLGTIRRLGPGMILAGAIVGSGELIATTRVGAETGVTLLWLIVFGCVVKVFVQVELGRYAITWGKTGLQGLDELPGPRLSIPLPGGKRIGGHLFLWIWLVVMILVLSQQGGIVGGVGQALSITMPLTQHGTEVNQLQNRWIDHKVQAALLKHENADPARIAALELQTAALQAQVNAMPPAQDALMWAGMLAVITAIALYVGHYGLIQTVSTLLVAMFTLVTIMTVLLIQLQPQWALHKADLLHGFSFHVPGRGAGGSSPMATALGAFGIIGVGAFELLMYPYWCLEKGYGRWTGPRDGSPQWFSRARGWMRVMNIDVWVSMAVYTGATVAFYWLGAAVLGRTHLIPQNDQMIRTLSEMYVPVFGGEWAKIVFLIGAFAVLYSTYFVAAAGCARLLADSFGLFGLTDGSEAARQRWSAICSIAWPLVAYLLFAVIRAPAAMVIWSGVAQALLLPIVGTVALWQRYRRCDRGLRPGVMWDLMLWLSVTSLFVIAVWSLWENIWLGLIKPLLPG